MFWFVYIKIISIINIKHYILYITYYILHNTYYIKLIYKNLYNKYIKTIQIIKTIQQNDYSYKMLHMWKGNR